MNKRTCSPSPTAPATNAGAGGPGGTSVVTPAVVAGSLSHQGASKTSTGDDEAASTISNTACNAGTARSVKKPSLAAVPGSPLESTTGQEDSSAASTVNRSASSSGPEPLAAAIPSSARKAAAAVPRPATHATLFRRAPARAPATATKAKRARYSHDHDDFDGCDDDDDYDENPGFMNDLSPSEFHGFIAGMLSGRWGR